MKKAIRITTGITINSSAEKAWDLLYTRFGDTILYNPNLVGSHFTQNTKGEVGCERECRLDSKTFIRETIIQADLFRSFTLKVSAGNMPLMKEMQVQILINSLLAENTRITANAMIRTKPVFMGHLMKGLFRKKLTDMLIGLKYYMETGKTVTRQSYRQIYREYLLLPPGGSWEIIGNDLPARINII